LTLTLDPRHDPETPHDPACTWAVRNDAGHTIGTAWHAAPGYAATVGDITVQAPSLPRVASALATILENPGDAYIVTTDPERPDRYQVTTRAVESSIRVDEAASTPIRGVLAVPNGYAAAVTVAQFADGHPGNADIYTERGERQREAIRRARRRRDGLPANLELEAAIASLEAAR
jgi:hypothetical protein